MNDKASNEVKVSEATDEAVGRRLFLQTTGKWSGAAIVAAVAGTWFASAPEAGAWINRRGGGGGWINGGGGGGWVNRRGGGGSWVNRF